VTADNGIEHLAMLLCEVPSRSFGSERQAAVARIGPAGLKLPNAEQLGRRPVQPVFL